MYLLYPTFLDVYLIFIVTCPVISSTCLRVAHGQRTNDTLNNLQILTWYSSSKPKYKHHNWKENTNSPLLCPEGCLTHLPATFFEWHFVNPGHNTTNVNASKSKTCHSVREHFTTGTGWRSQYGTSNWAWFRTGSSVSTRPLPSWSRAATGEGSSIQ